MTLARIDNNAIAELREIAIEDVPEHKRYLWLPVVGDPPADLTGYTGPTYEIGATEVTRVWTPSSLDAVQAQKIAVAWAEHNRRFEAYIVMVTVNGASRPYGCDAVTRENILAITNAMALGIQTEPRPFTPKGEIVPVETTFAEFKAIYAAGLAAGDAHYIAYATHKAAIAALADVQAVLAYDVTTGWPV